MAMPLGERRLGAVCIYENGPKGREVAIILKRQGVEYDLDAWSFIYSC